MRQGLRHRRRVGRWAWATGGGLLLLALTTVASSRGMLIVDGGFQQNFGGGEQNQEADPNLPQAIRQALTMSAEPGMDNWAWRNAVENRLVDLGPRALPLMRLESDQRQGYELDALQVAIFRLENAPLDPQAAIEAFAARQFGGTTAIRITRVFGGTGLASLHELLPHHLFYAVQSRATPPVPAQRLVIALAADSKIQSLSDDASLAKFLRTELDPAQAEPSMEAVAGAVAQLAIARYVSFYRPDELQTELHGRVAQATLKSAPHEVLAKVTFDPNGRVSGIVTGDRIEAQPAAIPIVPPEAARKPPPMPD